MVSALLQRQQFPLPEDMPVTPKRSSSRVSDGGGRSPASMSCNFRPTDAEFRFFRKVLQACDIVFASDGRLDLAYEEVYVRSVRANRCRRKEIAVEDWNKLIELIELSTEHHVPRHQSSSWGYTKFLKLITTLIPTLDHYAKTTKDPRVIEDLIRANTYRQIVVATRQNALLRAKSRLQMNQCLLSLTGPGLVMLEDEHTRFVRHMNTLKGWDAMTLQFRRTGLRFSDEVISMLVDPNHEYDHVLDKFSDYSANFFACHGLRENLQCSR